MKLIKIGGTYLNLDQVTRIDDDGSELMVQFAVTVSGPDEFPRIPDGIVFQGADAVALRAYLDGRTDDVLAEYQAPPTAVQVSA